MCYFFYGCFFSSLYTRRTCHSLHWCNCLTPCCLPDAMLSSDSRMMEKELQAEELEHMHIIQWFKVHVYTWTKQQSRFESVCIMYAFPTVCFNCNISSRLNLFLMLSLFVEHMVLLLNEKLSEIFLLLWSWPWVLLRDQTHARNTWKNCLFSLIAYYVLHPFNMFLKTV